MELDLFSDMQQSNMPGNFADMVMPGNVALVLHRVGPAAAVAELDGAESVQAPWDSWWIRKKARGCWR